MVQKQHSNLHHCHFMCLFATPGLKTIINIYIADTPITSHIKYFFPLFQKKKQNKKTRLLHPPHTSHITHTWIIPNVLVKTITILARMSASQILTAIIATQPPYNKTPSPLLQKHPKVKPPSCVVG